MSINLKRIYIFRADIILELLLNVYIACLFYPPGSIVGPVQCLSRRAEGSSLVEWVSKEITETGRIFQCSSFKF